MRLTVRYAGQVAFCVWLLWPDAFTHSLHIVPPSGHEYEAVYVVISNRGTGDLQIEPRDFYLVADGVRYRQDPAAVASLPKGPVRLSTTVLDAGDETEGLLAFCVPSGCGPRSLEWELDEASAYGVWLKRKAELVAAAVNSCKTLGG